MTKMTREGIINFICRNPPPEGEEKKDVFIEAAGWLDEKWEQLLKPPDRPFFFQRVEDGELKLFKVHKDGECYGGRV